MKYSHIIYNSSERNRMGAVGLGVRSATAGTSPDLINTLVQNEVFTFKEVGTKPSPSALAANPEAIKQIVPSYFFKTLAQPGSEKVYVLGRKIAVGFDYSFYINGKSTRLGNYVVDSYLFHECPTAEEFEIFLESPAAGSNHFIPADPAPRQENEEMRAISVGHVPDLKEEELSFRSAGGVKINQRDVSMLFAFIKSRKDGIPLLVKADVAAPPKLMAALAKLVPQKLIEDLTFISNHSDMGKKPGINILFVNEYYLHDTSSPQWVELDFSKDDAFESPESKLFRPIVEKYVEEGNFAAIHRLVSWCLSEVYEKSKNLDRESQNELYYYVCEYPRFNIDALNDEKLRVTLNDYLKANPKEAERLMDSLQKEYETVDKSKSLKDLCGWINRIIAISPIDATPVIEKNKESINGIIFDSADSFKKFYSIFRQRWDKGIKDKLIIEENFPKHSSYLSSLTNDNYEDWKTLYPLFLKANQGDGVYLIKRMLDDGVSKDVRDDILDKEFKDDRSRVLAFTNILKLNPGDHEKELISMMMVRAKKLSPFDIDFFGHFKNKYDNELYAPLFERQIEAPFIDNEQNPDLKKMLDNLKAFEVNDDSARWAKNESGKRVFNQLYETIVTGVAPSRRKLTKEEGIEICEKLIDSNYPKIVLRRFHILRDALKGSLKPTEYAGIRDYWNIAGRIGDKEYRKALAPHFLRWFDNSDKTDVNKNELYSAEAEAIDNGYMKEEDILDIAKKSELRDDYIVGLLTYHKGKPQEQLEYLLTKVGMSDEEALALLSKYYPESHEAILKSREPSIFKKIMGIFKGKGEKGKGKKDDFQPSPEDLHGLEDKGE